MNLTDAKLVFLDLETTGLAPAMGDRIVEIGMVICRGNQEIRRIAQLVDPQQPIPANAQEVHGIRDEDVAGSPPFGRISRSVCRALSDAWLIGHNIRFDLGFLAMEIALAGRSVTPAGCLDTCQLAKALWELPNYQLDTVAAALDLQRGPVHRALGDAEASKAIFDEAVNELGGWSGVDSADLEALHAYPPTWPRDPRRSMPGILYDALTSGRPISIRYVNGEGKSSSREIRPYACFPAGRNVYVRAHCNHAGQMRTFRLDRIVEFARLEAG
ncbi:MAG: exonuclease domain-containing protein [Phycisphaerae bacterium]